MSILMKCFFGEGKDKGAVLMRKEGDLTLLLNSMTHNHYLGHRYALERGRRSAGVGLVSMGIWSLDQG